MKRHEVVLLLLLSFAWECVEHYLETQGHPAVIRWFCGVEHWSNRLVMDHLCVLAGYWVFTRRPALMWWMRGMSAAWLLTHVFALPDSMFLHSFLPSLPGVFGDKQHSPLDVWSIEHVLAGVSAGALVRLVCSEKVP